MRSVGFHLSYTVLHLLTQACVQIFSRKALFLLWSRGLHSVKHSLWARVRRFLVLCERRLGSFLDVISEQDPEALCFGLMLAGWDLWDFGRYQDRYRHSNIRERGDIYRHRGRRVSFVTSLSWWLNVQTRIDEDEPFSHTGLETGKVVFLNWPIQRDEATTAMFLVQRPPASISSSTLFYGFDGFMP